jgi:hypothetical protein
VGGHHTNGAPGLDFFDKLSQATGNAQAPDRENVRHACLWKATIMLLSRYKVAYEKKRKIMRNVAPVAELIKSFFDIPGTRFRNSGLRFGDRLVAPACQLEGVYDGLSWSVLCTRSAEKEHLSELDSDEKRLDYIQLEIEEPREHLLETEKAWDTIHRCRTDEPGGY